MNDEEIASTQTIDIAQTSDDLELNESVNEDELMLTTIDNPFNPKDAYDQWQRWDKDNGYHTEEYIARLIMMDGDYDVDDEFALNLATSRVIADILANDDQDVYCLV